MRRLGTKKDFWYRIVISAALISIAGVIGLPIFSSAGFPSVLNVSPSTFWLALAITAITLAVVNRYTHRSLSLGGLVLASVFVAVAFSGYMNPGGNSVSLFFAAFFASIILMALGGAIGDRL